jgi:S1-C subfamily serine protease
VEHYERILAEYRDAYEFRGMTLARVFPALLEVMQPAGGLVVLKVRAGSPAAAAGVSPGDSLLVVDTQRVTTVEELRTAARSAWRQPDVRRRLMVEIEHQGSRRRVFVGRPAETGAP